MKDEAAFLLQMRKNFQEAETAEADNRDAGLSDLKFINNYDNEQWASQAAAERTVDRRPMLSNNLLRKYLRSLMGAMKMSRPGIKVLPKDVAGSPEVAELMTAAIREIERDNECPAVQAYDCGYRSALSNAFGYLRIVTTYDSPVSFDQKIQIKRVSNPFSVYFDPMCQNFLNTDARYAFVHTMMDRESFRRKWPKAQPLTGNNVAASQGEAMEGWFASDTVRVTEYFYAVPVRKKIALLASGSIVELDDQITPEVIRQGGNEILKLKEVVTRQYMWCKLSGNEILEQPRPWPGHFIPIVPIYGDETNIEGKRVLTSFFRDAKDPQRMYNFWLTAATELVALTPKAPYIGTAKQFEGYEKEWEKANRKNFSRLIYKPDPRAPGPPQRTQNSDIPAGHITMLNIAQANVMNTLGMFEASIGQKSNERSGKAILARKSAGDRVSFSYLDNFYQSLLMMGYLIVDLLPKIYDTTRILRVRQTDSTVNFVKVNVPYYDTVSRSVKLANNLALGNYDTELDISPSYATRRQEAAQSMMEFVQYIPGAGPLIADLIAQNMDWPGAQEIAQRLRAITTQGAKQA